MYCPKCGNENSDTSKFCVKCANPMAGGPDACRHGRGRLGFVFGTILPWVLTAILGVLLIVAVKQERHMSQRSLDQELSSVGQARAQSGFEVFDMALKQARSGGTDPDVFRPFANLAITWCNTVVSSLDEQPGEACKSVSKSTKQGMAERGISVTPVRGPGPEGTGHGN